MMEDDEEETCPLCMEPMDVTDQSASLCDCGYSMCLWCWHQIMENAAKDSLPARCPNCRSEYDKERITNATVDPEKVAQAMQKKREEKKKSKVLTDRKALANVRVIQRNLVYVVGLSMHICREEALRKQDYFGQFGRIVKISVNRAGPYSSASTAKSSPTGSAYITFVRNADALRCIEAIDGCTWDGNSVGACFGTTKYCNSFLKGITCTNPDCLYLHDIAPEDNESFTKEQMLARYGNQKSSNFFELTHPLASQQQQQEHTSMAEMREMEMRESDNMRSQPQNIPQGTGQYGSRNDSWSGQGGAWGSPPPPPPPRGMGPPPGMHPGMSMPPGMQAGMGLPGGLGHRRQSSGGGGMVSANSGSFDGPSWGQVAAAGNRGTPPPPPPSQPAAQEEWPELGAGPKLGDTAMAKAASGSGKIPVYKALPASGLAPGAKLKGELSNMMNGRSESMETLGGVMVAKPPAGRSKAPGPPGGSAPGGNLSSPFLTAAGPQSAPMAKQNSGMLTMTLPSNRTDSASVATARNVSGKVVKGPPPGFAPPLTSSASTSAAAASSGVRGPPPGFAGPSSSTAAAAPQRSGSNDNDVLNSLVASLKGELVAPQQKSEPPPPPVSVAAPAPTPTPAPPPTSAPTGGEPLAQALQGLELLGAGANGSQHGGRQGGMPSLPPGFDVWSADVPPAYAGLATAAYNPMGLSSQGDPSARYLLRNPPANAPGPSGTTIGPPGSARGAGAGTGSAAADINDSLGSSGQSRSRSRFQFAQEDSKEGVSDPLWQGASGDGIPAAVDIFKLLRQGNSTGAAGMKPPPGFGGVGEGGGGGMGVPPGMALLQQLQLGRGGQTGAAAPGFMDPAIITSRAGMVSGPPQQSLRPSGGSGVVRPPPGFGGGQQQQQPMYAGRGIDTVAADSSTQHWDSR